MENVAATSSFPTILTMRRRSSTGVGRGSLRRTFSEGSFYHLLLVNEGQEEKHTYDDSLWIDSVSGLDPFGVSELTFEMSYEFDDYSPKAPMRRISSFEDTAADTVAPRKPRRQSSCTLSTMRTRRSLLMASSSECLHHMSPSKPRRMSSTRTLNSNFSVMNSSISSKRSSTKHLPNSIPSHRIPRLARKISQDSAPRPPLRRQSTESLCMTGIISINT
jgi:hypothetical protein